MTAVSRVKLVSATGRGSHKTILISSRCTSDRIIRLRHEVAQLEFKINPSTLCMNGGSIRVVRKRMAKLEVRPCFDVAAYAKRHTGGNVTKERRLIREYTRQLSDQERGTNNLTVGEHRTARQAYIDLGWHGVSDGAAQAGARNRLATTVTRNIDGSLARSRPDMTPRQRQQIAAQQTLTIMSKLAALHNPDMIAGGYDRINRVAESGINSSIGASWGDYRRPDSRIARIDAAAADPNLDPNAKMNISLPPCRI